MNIASTLDRLHFQAKDNRWLRYFAVFNRLILAIGFIPPGIVKISGERFTSLSGNHPMGHYLEAFYHTGFYYPFVGVMQVTAGILLLIPRTATLGALIYFPIILNICILSFAVRFDGSILSSPLMILANLYLFCWDYDKLKFILPLKYAAISDAIPKQKKFSNKFPTKFFAGAAAAVIVLVLVILNLYDIMPRNTLKDCKAQFKDGNKTKAGGDFCNCIHKSGEPLDKCLHEYDIAPEDIIGTP